MRGNERNSGKRRESGNECLEVGKRRCKGCVKNPRGMVWNGNGRRMCRNGGWKWNDGWRGFGFEMPGERDEEDDGGIDIVRVDDDLCGVAAWEPSRRPTRLRGA